MATHLNHVPVPLANGAWAAPAKINLFLHITGRRSDGYHRLQTVFQLLDYYDELFFEIVPSKPIRIEVIGATINDKENLCVHAAKTLQSMANTHQGVTMRLIKKIPIGGGMGGGSSNAATVLVVLNYLWKLNYSIDQLIQIAADLGADVPVFVLGSSAWGEGIGDILEPLCLKNQWYLVINPGVEVLTKKIFSSRRLTRDTNTIKIRDFLSASKKVKNDCESLVRQLYPEINQVMDWLNQFATSYLTGTGCCVFASFEDRLQAEEILKRLPDKWQGFVSQGTNNSLLYGHEPSDGS